MRVAAQIPHGSPPEQESRLVVGSPIGDLTLLSTDDALTGLILPPRETALPDVASAQQAEPDQDSHVSPILNAARRELAAYFRGELRVFSIPLRPAGTEFELAVWRAVRQVPYGETAAYAQIARQLGPSVSPRAVGRANARNPIPIIIPCHRIIGSDGSLTGYGGGLARKRYLLDLEAGSAWLS